MSHGISHWSPFDKYCDTTMVRKQEGEPDEWDGCYLTSHRPQRYPLFPSLFKILDLLMRKTSHFHINSAFPFSQVQRVLRNILTAVLLCIDSRLLFPKPLIVLKFSTSTQSCLIPKRSKAASPHQTFLSSPAMSNQDDKMMPNSGREREPNQSANPPFLG